MRRVCLYAVTIWAQRWWRTFVNYRSPTRWAFGGRSCADHNELNAIVVEARVIAAENMDGISYCLDRAEIALIFRL